MLPACLPIPPRPREGGGLSSYGAQPSALARPGGLVQRLGWRSPNAGVGVRFPGPPLVARPDGVSELATGSVFAGHRIRDVAGRGGMGVVYRPAQLALDRTVALKVVAPGLLDDHAMRAPSVRE